MKSVCLSGNGQGEIALAIMRKLLPLHHEFPLVADVPKALGLRWIGPLDHPAPDVAICTIGRMRIADAADIDYTNAERLMESNYLLPRCFTERHIATMRRDSRRGLIIHIGSNAAWYGNVGAEDYAAGKTALRKYLELRARQVRADGIRISLLGFAGVATKGFWEKAVEWAQPGMADSIVAGLRQPLTPDEVADVVIATMRLPDNVCLRDALITSVDYQ